MKNYFVILFGLLSFFSCKKDDDSKLQVTPINGRLIEEQIIISEFNSNDTSKVLYVYENNRLKLTIYRYLNNSIGLPDTTFYAYDSNANLESLFKKYNTGFIDTIKRFKYYPNGLLKKELNYSNQNLVSTIEYQYIGTIVSHINSVFHSFNGIDSTKYLATIENENITSMELIETNGLPPNKRRLIELKHDGSTKPPIQEQYIDISSLSLFPEDRTVLQRLSKNNISEITILENGIIKQHHKYVSSYNHLRFPHTIKEVDGNKTITRTFIYD